MKLLTTLTILMFAAGSVSQIRADEDSPLAKAMTTTNDAMKALGKEKDSAKGAALAREAQDGIVKSIPLVPELIADMPDAAARSKAMADYRKMLAQALALFCDIETAFLNNKADDVTKLITDAKALKKEGHKKYMDEEE
jgi:hypothetical protein